MSSSGKANAKWIGVLLVVGLMLGGVWKWTHMPEPPTISIPTVPSPVPMIVTPSPRPIAPPTEKHIAKHPTPPHEKPTKPVTAKLAPVSPVFVKPPVPVVPPPLSPIPLPEASPETPQEWHGNDTSITHVGQVVIRNDRQWVHFWSEHHPHEPAPEIDFSTKMVLGVFAGPRPADAFSIRMVDLRNESGKLLVTYRERLPPTGTFAVNVTVYPFEIKVIPRSDLPVTFKAMEPENVVR